MSLYSSPLPGPSMHSLPHVHWVSAQHFSRELPMVSTQPNARDMWPLLTERSAASGRDGHSYFLEVISFPSSSQSPSLSPAISGCSSTTRFGNDPWINTDVNMKVYLGVWMHWRLIQPCWLWLGNIHFVYGNTLVETCQSLHFLMTWSLMTYDISRP